MQSGTSFTRKKAPLAAAKIMKKLPDHLPDIIEKLGVLMEDRHHGKRIHKLSYLKQDRTISPLARFPNKTKYFFCLFCNQKVC